MDRKKIEDAVRLILEAIGENPAREGLRDTPRRVAEMYSEVFAGLHHDPRSELEVSFHEEHDELILVRDIRFYSMCEHHLLPFFGQAHVAYVPADGRLTGLSRLIRVVETVARRPQMQERMTAQIADTLMQGLRPQGVCVVIEAEHLCMSMRGTNKPGALAVTSAMRGIFRTDAKTRAEALALIRPHLHAPL
ncbi:MAG: GTP cyclohydrolase I FolE [Limnochordales bacterium]|nr:GTP cyclohydrolase I FolE [Limnochordales bacterium]